MKISRKAYTIFYVLLLVNILLIAVYVLFSNLESNKLNIDSASLKNKMNIALEKKAKTDFETFVQYTNTGTYPQQFQLGTVLPEKKENIFFSNKKLRDFGSISTDAQSLYKSSNAKLSLSFSGSNSLSYNVIIYTLDQNSQAVNVTNITKVDNQTSSSFLSDSLDFTNNDYAIFVHNKTNAPLYYKLSAETNLIPSESLTLFPVEYKNKALHVFVNHVLEEGGSLVAKSKPFIYDISVIENHNSGKRWSDGSYAQNCNAYKHPGKGYMYYGDTGDGMYYIDPDGAGGENEFLAYCDMTTDGGGWTQVLGLENQEIILNLQGFNNYTNFTVTSNSVSLDTNVSCDLGAIGVQVVGVRNISHIETRFDNLQWTGSGGGDLCNKISKTNIREDGISIPEEISTNTLLLKGIMSHPAENNIYFTCACTGSDGQKGAITGGSIYIR